MAHTSRLANHVRGCVTGLDIVESSLVTLVENAGPDRVDLPRAVLATAGQTKNVWWLEAPPDDFPRPTDERLYGAKGTNVYNPNTGWSEPKRTTTVYDVGRSAFWNPTIPSGQLALAKRDGTVSVPSGMFVDSSNIRTKGAKIKVGANGKPDYTAVETDAIGQVEEFDTVNNTLIFVLY